MASIKIVLFKSKTLKDETHPVMLRVIINRSSSYYSLGGTFKCKEKQWDEVNSRFIKGYKNYKEANRNLTLSEGRAESILIDLEKENPNFTHADFKKRFIEKEQKRFQLFKYMQSVADRINDSGQPGTANNYKSAIRVFKKFLGKDDIDMSEVDSKLLSRFIEYSQGRNIKPNTFKKNLVCIRASYNRAIKEDNYTYYPFKDFSISHLQNKTPKRAISKSDISNILNFQADQESGLFHARQYFIFMYLCYGLNFSDFARLTEDNIIKGNDHQILTYTRRKTGKLYQIPLVTKAIEILDFYRQRQKGKYIFPILDENIHTSPKLIYNQISNSLFKYNRSLKKVASELGIQQKITSYVARHSFASVLVKSGTNLFTISEMMGHSDPVITKIYIQDLDFDDKMEAAKNLID